jgi:hypothetical protein
MKILIVLLLGLSAFAQPITKNGVTYSNFPSISKNFEPGKYQECTDFINEQRVEFRFNVFKTKCEVTEDESEGVEVLRGIILLYPKN